nr:metallophosphoesterase [Kineosporia mesophila]
MVITFAHLSDLHIDLGERATDRARRLIDAVRPMAGLDAVLVTGDIADHGTPQEYAVVRDLLARFEVPVLTLPGNHDVREHFGPALLARPSPKHELNQAIAVGDTDFLLCDSTIPGQSGGELSGPTLEWLKSALADRDPDRRALIAFHHPPAVLHIPGVDRIRQIGEMRLAGIVSAHPEVAALLCGHAHTGFVTTFAGRPLVGAPGCVSTSRLPVEQRGSYELDSPPGYALHVLDDDGRLVTHFRAL